MPSVCNRWELSFFLTLTTLLAAPASAVTVDWVLIGDPDNGPDTENDNCFGLSEICGSVSYSYHISRYEVTNAQYVEFLNAKAASDPLELYDTLMASGFGGIARSGDYGSYTYAAKPGWEDRPVNFVSFFDAARFANWMHNGQGAGDTESGAYTLLGSTAVPSNSADTPRNPGALVFLPSENEWYKAAYYDGLTATYLDWPTGTSTHPACSTPTATPDRANCGQVFDTVTPVGVYTGSASPYGTFDQGGNVREWNEESSIGYAGSRGGSYVEEVTSLNASYMSQSLPKTYNIESAGFRVASVPEAGTSLPALLTLGLIATRRCRVSNTAG